MNRLTRLGEGVHAGEFPLQVGLLVFGQSRAELVEPAVDRVTGDLLFNHAALVQQRHDRTVRHRLVDGVGVDQAAKGRQRITFLLEQRRECHGRTHVSHIATPNMRFFSCTSLRVGVIYLPYERSKTARYFKDEDAYR